MNNAHAHLISFDSRSATLARVCLEPDKTGSEPAWTRFNQGNTIGTDLNRHPLPLLSLTRRHARRGCAMLKFP